MKRSEINHIIQESKNFFSVNSFFLPEWGDWCPDDWLEIKDKCSEIVDNSIGWDITDFGSERFDERGLVLFTVRNGNLDKTDKVYCEKIMISAEDQETPMHFHWNKTEDIINRGGGRLILEAFLATDDDKLSDQAFQVKIDGVLKDVKPGEQIILMPGQSICMTPRIYHRFYAQKGYGKVMIGEVSTVNDDKNDNRFYEEMGRFPAIDEDVPPVHLLVTDYEKYLYP